MSGNDDFIRGDRGRFKGRKPSPVSPQQLPISKPHVVEPVQTDTRPIEADVEQYSSLAEFLNDRLNSMPVVVLPHTVVKRIETATGMRENDIKDIFDHLRATSDLYEDFPAPRDEFRFDRHPDAPTDTASQRALRHLGYRVFLDQPHPVFVYGSLREGFGNHGLLYPAKTHLVAAEMPDMTLRANANSGYPYALEGDGRIAGEVVWLSDDEEGDAARDRLDYLEGFDSQRPSSSHYQRIEREILVTPPGESQHRPVKVWVYVAGGMASMITRDLSVIPSGDWKTHVRESASHRPRR